MADTSTAETLHKLQYNGEHLDSLLDNVNTIINVKDGTTTPYIKVQNGGTGKLVFTANNILVGNGDKEIGEIKNSSGVLYSDGSATPAFTKVLSAANGGTGIGTDGFPTIIGVLVYDSSTKKYKFITPSSDSDEGVLLYKKDNGSLSFSSNITKVGTITSGQWQGSVIDVNHGGTGKQNLSEFKTALLSTDGAIPVAYGGTGATDADNARANLGINYENLGIVPVSKGGTGYSGTDKDSLIKYLNLSLANISEVGDTIVPITAGGTGANTLSGMRETIFNNYIVPLSSGGTGVSADSAENLIKNLEVQLSWLKIDATDTTFVVPITLGGTGCSSIEAFKQQLALKLSDFVQDTIPIGNGGTGADSLEDAQESLGIVKTVLPLDESITIDKNYNRAFLKAKGDKAITITLPTFDEFHNIEFEVLNAESSSSVNITWANGTKVYNPKISKATSIGIESCGVVSIKYLGDNEWVIHGDIKTVS